MAKEKKATEGLKEEKGQEVTKGVGLDPGTMNLVSARYTSKEKVGTKRIRNVFMSLGKEVKRRLRLGKVSFIEREDEDDLVVLGDAALEFASSFGSEIRRPLKAGLISPQEADALSILGTLISNVLGDPREEGEICYFSVPAPPIDMDRDVVYHTGVLEKIITECGYEAYESNEALAVIYAETAKENFSGVGISFGAGMTNVAMAVNAVPAGMEFSIARAGDWVDKGASSSLGLATSRICSVKEQGVDLMNPHTREAEAISFYYKNLIDYVLKKVSEQFRLKCQLAIGRPIPIIVSGGTSMAGGFMELFENRFKRIRRRFPIEVSEIRHAKDPLTAVAHGCLVQAVQEYVE